MRACLPTKSKPIHFQSVLLHIVLTIKYLSQPKQCSFKTSWTYLHNVHIISLVWFLLNISRPILLHTRAYILIWIHLVGSIKQNGELFYAAWSLKILESWWTLLFVIWKTYLIFSSLYNSVTPSDTRQCQWLPTYCIILLVGSFSLRKLTSCTYKTWWKQRKYSMRIPSILIYMHNFVKLRDVNGYIIYDKTSRYIHTCYYQQQLVRFCIMLSLTTLHIMEYQTSRVNFRSGLLHFYQWNQCCEIRL